MVSFMGLLCSTFGQVFLCHVSEGLRKHQVQRAAGFLTYTTDKNGMGNRDIHPLLAVAVLVEAEFTNAQTPVILLVEESRLFLEMACFR